MANVRKYGCAKPVKNNNPVRWPNKGLPRGKKKGRKEQ